MTSIILNPGMGAEVLARLSSFVDLPATGFVAGQAVASAVSELFGDGKGVVYNDVDLFRAFEASDMRTPRMEYEYDYENKAASSRAIGTCTFQTLEIEESYQELSVTGEKCYKVLRTTRNDMLNEVLCSFSSRNIGQFLRTFDMNGVQTGVDLSTGLLHWTPAFERFSRTRELSIVGLHTPFHSLIRYFRKRQELAGISGNDERMMELIALLHEREIADARIRNSAAAAEAREYEDLRWGFGTKVLEKFNTVGGSLSSNFEVSTKLVKGYPVNLLVPKYEVDKDLQEVAKGAIIGMLPLLSEALRETRDPVAMERLSYLARADSTRSLSQRLWAVHGMSFVDSAITAEQISTMDELVSRKEIQLHFNQSSLEAKWNHFQAVTAEAENHGEWLYSVLSRKSCLKLKGTRFQAYMANIAWVVNSTKFKPFLPPVVIDGYRVTEMTDAVDLIKEGAHLSLDENAVEFNQDNNWFRISTAVPVSNVGESFIMNTETSAYSLFARHSELRSYGSRFACLTDEQHKVASEYVKYSKLSHLVGPRIAAMLIAHAPSVAKSILPLAVSAFEFGPSVSRAFRNFEVRIAAGAQDPSKRFYVIQNKYSVINTFFVNLPKYAHRKVMQKLTGKPMRPVQTVGSHMVDDSMDVPF